MARMRSVKPEYWADQSLTQLPREVRLLYIALWNFADEQGRMQADPRLVKSWCFPLDDDLTTDMITEWLGLLEGAGKVVRYEIDGLKYLHLPKLSKHQKLDPRLPSRLPEPPETLASPLHIDQSVRTGVANTGTPPPVSAKHVASGREHVAGGARTDRAVRGTRIDPNWKPDQQLIEWQRKEKIPDPLARRELPKFINYWLGKTGKDSTKADWPATWRNWLLRASEASPRPVVDAPERSGASFGMGIMS